MNDSKPVLTIITVVYNAFNVIGKTITSVLDQSYEHIEFIIIDGASTDGTFEQLVQQKSNFSHLQSEPDNGIYDAMNKGLARATGDYILFLNAGDELSSDTIVEELFKTAVSTGSIRPDLYYGSVLLIDEAGQILGERRHKPPVSLDWRSFKMGMLVSHQAFIPARVITSPYRTDLKISADIDWCIACLKKADTIVNTGLIISKYLTGGLSRQNTWLSWKERFSVMQKYYGLGSTLFFHLIIIVRFTGYYIISRRLD